MRTSTKWYESEIETLELMDDDAEQMPLVISMIYHGPSAWKLETDEYLEIQGSNAAAELLRLVEEGMEIDYDEDGRIRSANLTFRINTGKAVRASRLIERVRVYVTGFAMITLDALEKMQPMIASKRDIKIDKKTKEIKAVVLTCESHDHAQALVATMKDAGLKAQIPTFANSYRLTKCEPVKGDPGSFWLTANLALQQIIQGKKKEKKVLSLIDAKISFQQLLASFLAPPDMVENVQANLFAGICQEVAQQVTSYLGQLDSERVKGEVKFPTVETRDPAERLKTYYQAIEALVSDLRPLERATARDLDPTIPPEDPKGDRIVFTDERWMRIIRNAGPPKPLTLFFVKSDVVRIFRGETILPTDVTRRSLHSPAEKWKEYSQTDLDSGRQTASGALRAGKKNTMLVQYYAAIPVPSDDPKIQETFSHRDEGRYGRKLPLNLTPVALHGENLTKKQRRVNPEDLLIPLEFDRERIERVLNSRHYEIKWCRRVRRGEDRYLQLTIGVRLPTAESMSNILGVAFGIDASAFWCIMNDSGAVTQNGRLGPNEQIQKFLGSKARMEWDQKQGRWTGGRGFSGVLKSIAHRKCVELLEMAGSHNAALSVEDLVWVQKSGPDSKRNTLFTALNFGQMRRFLDYKAQLNGRGQPWFASGYVTGHMCPKCRALTRGKAEEDKRLTFWKDAQLHCRSCGYEGVPSGDDKARAAAVDLFEHLQKRKEEKE